MTNERSADEILRLGIVDELQRSAAEVAMLTVDLEEVMSETESLEQATATQHRAVEEQCAEAKAREETQKALAEHCALLEAKFQQALAAPVVLRAELYECEQQTESAAAAEAEAKQTAVLLQRELESLHN